MLINKSISVEIKQIFDANTLNDLKKFLNKRECLNTTNIYLTYLFYFVQSAGILTTSIATGNNNYTFIWVGVGLNVLATLINTYEKINNSQLKKLLKDIENIKNGSYTDETEIIDIEEEKKSSLESPLITEI